MNHFSNLRDKVFRSRKSVISVISLTLVILAIALLAAQLAFRERMRSQILEQDAAILQNLGLMQHEAGQSSGEFAGASDKPESYFDELLAISRFHGVIGVRLFDARGEFVNAFPFHIKEATLEHDDLTRLKENKPASRFVPKEPISEIDFLTSPTNSERIPIMVVSIPLPSSSGFIGAAQFIIQGQSTAEAWAKLDRELVSVGLNIFIGCGALLTLILIIGFRRLRRMNQMLFEANQDLAMAARTNAVGAVAAHLIHGLKNPLSGLYNFVTESAGSTNPEWQSAVASTKRMQLLINKTVNILQERQTGVEYEITLSELTEMLNASLKVQARDAGLGFDITLDKEAVFSSGDASLIMMILENLIQNAFQATPIGKFVHLRTSRADGMLHFDVVDQGPGFPLQLADSLFKPCRSTKIGGGGIGLAICKQIALQLESNLQLLSSTPEGCVFRLSYPLARETVAQSRSSAAA